jgi:hypothetical protein
MTPAISVRSYQSALLSYLDTGKEPSLLAAYDVGRRLMAAGAGLLDVVRLHGKAVQSLDTPLDRHEKASADMFLAEVLAPFEMAYLGFKEANASLRELTLSLEDYSVAQVVNSVVTSTESLARAKGLPVFYSTRDVRPDSNLRTREDRRSPLRQMQIRQESTHRRCILNLHN